MVKELIERFNLYDLWTDLKADKAGLTWCDGNDAPKIRIYVFMYLVVDIFVIRPKIYFTQTTTGL